MFSSDAKKSEIHEVTDDSSTSPASNEQQGEEVRPHNSNPAGGDVWPARALERARARTNVAAITVVEADDLVDAPPGHVELNADLDGENNFYPTDKTENTVDEKEGSDFGASFNPPPGSDDPQMQNLSP